MWTPHFIEYIYILQIFYGIYEKYIYFVRIYIFIYIFLFIDMYVQFYRKL